MYAGSIDFKYLNVRCQKTGNGRDPSNTISFRCVLFAPRFFGEKKSWVCDKCSASFAQHFMLFMINVLSCF